MIRERVLIVKLDSMGDVVRTTACLEPLKRMYPHCHITWVTRREAAGLLAMNSWVDRILMVESNYLELLTCEEFDLALCPDADVLSASILRIVRAEEKRGYLADGRGGVIPLNDAAEAWWHMGVDDIIKRANRRTYGEWLYDILELPAPVARPWLRPSEMARNRLKSFLQEQAPAAKRLICFNTGASVRWQEKRWKARHYCDLALWIEAKDPDAAVVLTGGPAERRLNNSLLAVHPKFIDGGTNRSVEDFSALISACDWVLTPDSLGYHVACAVGTPAVCVVGPTAPWELDTYGTNKVVYSDLECIACYRGQCPFPVTCMDRLTPELVRCCLPSLEVGTLVQISGSSGFVVGRGRPTRRADSHEA